MEITWSESRQLKIQNGADLNGMAEKVFSNTTQLM